MATVGYNEICCKCGEFSLNSEYRYGNTRGECTKCGYFFESVYDFTRDCSVFKEGLFYYRDNQARGRGAMVNYWFASPAPIHGAHPVYLENNMIKYPGKLELKGIFLTAKMGLMEELRKMVDLNDSIVEELEPEYKMSLLHASALGGWVPIAEYLLQKGIPIDYQDITGSSALHIAAELDYTELVEFLLDKGADVNLLDNEMETPLHVAAYLNSFAMVLGWHTGSKTVQALLSAGANTSGCIRQLIFKLLWDEHFYSASRSPIYQSCGKGI